MGDRFYMILDGEAQAHKNQAGGQKAHVYDYKSGDYFGERALLTNEARAASIIVTVRK